MATNTQHRQDHVAVATAEVHDDDADTPENEDRTAEITSTFRKLGIEDPAARERLLRLANPSGLSETDEREEHRIETRTNTLVDAADERA